MQKIARVLLPLPFETPFDYRSEEEVYEGQYVKVPFGARQVVGVVWSLSEKSDVPEKKLRKISQVLNISPLSSKQKEFVEWTARYTLSPLGLILKMVLAPEAFSSPKETNVYSLNEVPQNFKTTPARTRLLEVLKEEQILTSKELLEKAHVGPSVLKGLVEQNIVLSQEKPEEYTYTQPDLATKGVELTPLQQEAAKTLGQSLDHFYVNVIDGVTGSGKTEVYFESVRQVLREGKQVLILLPEISLSAGFSDRFLKRFGVRPYLWHSDLTPKNRRETWQGVTEGKISCLAGARSALFLPFKNLGLIVVDEEHETSYKQEEGVHYNARDMAIVKAKKENIPVILASATPSLETLQNISQEKYGCVKLPNRVKEAVMPEIHLINRQHEKEPGWISPKLRQELAKNLEASEQSMLFLNRRGYAPLTLCKACGHREVCTYCSTWLVEHKNPPHLQCHHCGLEKAIPKTCSECGEENSYIACGPGVERVVEEVKFLFPHARVETMTSDSLKTYKQMASLLQKIENNEVDILVGTQMMAKGHHFPELTLVGVVDADLGFSGGDLRASERTYQLLHQVSGRAGREKKKGRVFLQTYQPTHPVMQALIAKDQEGFLEHELEMRRLAGMPPFGRLASFIISSADNVQAEAVAKNIVRMFPLPEGVGVFGPAPAPIAFLRGKYRWRVLVKAPRDVFLQPLIRSCLSHIKTSKDTKVVVDIDPYSFY